MDLIKKYTVKNFNALEYIYARLLDRDYPGELFGGLPGFARVEQGSIACCPFHDDSMPTLVIYHDRPEYFCFVCSARGDWLTYLQASEGLSFHDAFFRLSRKAGVDSPDYDEARWREELKRSSLMEALAGFFITRLYARQGEETLHYLYRRGYAMAEVEGSSFGHYPGCEVTREYLLSEGMLDAFDNLPAGVWSRDAEDFRLTMPFRDSSGRLMGFMGRDIGKKGPDAYRGLTDLSMLAHTPFLMYRARQSEEVIVVQGLLDALLLDRIGFLPAVAVGTQGLTDSQAEVIAFHGVKRCILCLGNGAGKEERTARAGELLSRRGVGTVVLPLEERYEDIDHYIRSTDLPDLRKLLGTVSGIRPASQHHHKDG